MAPEDDNEPRLILDNSWRCSGSMLWTGSAEDIHPHPLFPDRRTPIRRLINKLGLAGFRNTGPLMDMPLNPKRVVIPLKQHTEVACIPTVKVGEMVCEGNLIGSPPQGKLGANIHASISGRVQKIHEAVVIEA